MDKFYGCGCFLFVLGLVAYFCIYLKPQPSPDLPPKEGGKVVVEPPPPLSADSLVIDMDGTIINFKLCEPGELLFVKNIAAKGNTSVAMKEPYFIMETELTIGMYKKLKELSPELPDISVFNEYCNEKNEGDDKPLHGIIPFEKRDTSEALQYAEQICQALTKAYKQYGKTGMEVNIDEGFRIPTDYEWQYACRATKDIEEAKKYIYLGKLQNRNLDSGKNWDTILNSAQSKLSQRGSDGLENKYKSYMQKFWKDIWNRDFMLSTGDWFTGKPEQLLKIYLEREKVCKKPIPNEKIEEIVDSIPQTLFFYYLYDSPKCQDQDFLYSTGFCPVKKTELPNAWGLYDMHSNAYEIVRYQDSYRLKGGSFNTALPEEWMRFSIGYSKDISDLDWSHFKHAMPGIRLVISAKKSSDIDDEDAFTEEQIRKLKSLQD